MTAKESSPLECQAPRCLESISRMTSGVFTKWTRHLVFLAKQCPNVPNVQPVQTQKEKKDLSWFM